MPPGAFFFVFFSVKNVHFNWIIGFSGTRDVFFLSRANSIARCRRCFVAEFFQVYIVFLVVAIFAKTKCYSPWNLLVRINYRPVEAFYDHFSHENYKHHASTVTCSESKWKNPPGHNDHSRQKQTTRWKYFFVSIIILGHEYTGSASLVKAKVEKSRFSYAGFCCI